MVRLTHLRLENIRSYRTATIEFREGVNAIVGRNGAGKSTILQAIGYTLFDSLEGRKPDFVREGSSSGSIAVGLLEDREGSAYEVVRELKKSGPADWFVVDSARDLEVCRGSQDVQFFVRDLCNTRLDLRLLYTGIIGIRQGEFAQPFRLTRARRQAHFSPLLEVEKYKEAFTRLGQLEGPKGLIRDRIGALATDMARLEVRLENQDDLNAELQALKLAAARLEAMEEEGRKRLRLLAKASKGFEQSKRNLEDATSRQVQAQNELKAGRQQLETAAEEFRQSAAASEIVESSQADHNLHLETQNGLEQLTAELKAMRDLARRKDRTDARLAGYRERQAQGRERLQHLDQLSERQSLLAASARRYETLDKQRIALEHRVGTAADLREAESSARINMDRCQSRVDELTADVDRRRQTLAEAREFEDRRGALAERIRHLHQQQELAAQRLEQVDRQLSLLNAPDGRRETEPVHLCPVCNQPIEEELWQNLVAESEAAQRKLNSRIGRLAGDLAGSEQDARQIGNELDRLQAKIAGMPDDGMLQRAKSDLAIARNELDRAEEQIKEGHGLEQLLQAAMAGLADLEDDWSAFRANQRQIDTRTDIEFEMVGLEADIASLEADGQSLEADLAPFPDLEARETALTSTLDSTRQAYELVLTNQRVAAQMPARETRYRDLKQSTQALESRLATATAERAGCAAAYDEGAHVEHLAEMRKLELDSRERQTRLEATRQRLDTLAGHLEAMKLLAEQLAVRKAEHAAWEQRDRDLEAMRSAIRAMEPRMTRILNQRISRGAHAIHQELTNISSTELTWDETFNIALKVLGRARNFSQLSGGEQMTAALAVNLTMLQELSTVGFAFFDEPTTNLDADRRTELATRLNASRQVPQLIVISHDDTFEAQVDHVIRVAKTGNESEIQAFVA